jgi:hypothetical protein
MVNAQERQAKQKAAQKKADAEALAKDVANTLGAEVVTADTLERKENPEYKTRDYKAPPVKIEARWLGKRGRGWAYQLLDNGQACGEITFPPSQVHSSQGDFLFISKWIAEEKVKKGDLQEAQVIWKEHDEARGDAWEPDEYPESYPPEGSKDVL